MLKRVKMSKGLTFAIALLALLVVQGASFAFNNTAGAEFNGIYTRILDWVNGIPGIIAGIFFGIMGIIRGFQTGNLLWIFGGILFAAVVIALPSIVQGMGFVY